MSRGRAASRGEVVGVAVRRSVRRSATAWASAAERYRRAVDRYHESVRMMPDHNLRRELTHLAAPLEGVLDDVEQAAARRKSYDTDRAEEMLANIHRAATLCAHATEAAEMANDATRHHEVDDVARCLDTVRLLIKKIGEIGDQVNPQS